MEEKDNKTAEKLSYEKLEQAAMQLQQRLVMAESRLKSLDYVSMRLSWLFKVLENSGHFNIEFVEKVSNEVESILTVEEPTDDN